MGAKALFLVVLAVAAVFAAAVLLAGGSGPHSDGPRAASPRAAQNQRTGASKDTERHKVSGAHDGPVPILMYHVITDPPSDVSYPDLYVSADRFKAEIDGLAKAGYHGVTLGDVFDYWRAGYALPRKPVVVSFDDGYESQYRNALPVLSAHSWPGVLNLAVKNLKPSWGLKPSQVSKMIDAGWELDAHTIDHLDVTTLDAAGLHEQITGSRTELRRMFHQPVDFFCYPSGRYDDAAIAAVRKAGFAGATTTEPGVARPGEPYTLPRVRVNRSDSPQSVLRTLAAL